MFALQGPILVALCLWRGGPGIAERLRRHRVAGLAGGVLSLVAYAVVVWAQTRAPLAIVATLRETSVLWGAAAGGGRPVRRFVRSAALRPFAPSA